MKLYKQPEPIEIVRLTFRKIGQQYEYLILEKEDLENVSKTLKHIILKNIRIDPFYSGKKVAIDIRQYKGKKAGKSISVSFKSEVSISELREIVLNNLL